MLLNRGPSAFGSIFQLPGEDIVPVALIDFANGVYQVNGEDVAITELVGDSLPPNDPFSTDSITPGVGFDPQDGEPTGFTLQGAALSTMTTSGYMVIVASPTSMVRADIHDDDWTYYVELSLHQGFIYDDNTEAMIEISDHPTSGEHTYIVALGDGIAGFNIDEGPPVMTTDNTFTPYSTAQPTIIEFGCGGTPGAELPGYIKSIAVYPWS